MDTLKCKKNFKRIALLLLSVIFLTFQFGTVLAESVTSDNYNLKASDTLEGTQFISGDKINIAGNINGTTFVAGSDINISGVIDGDLFVAGQNITVSGTVNGSLIIAAQEISIDGTVANNIYSAGSNLTLKSENKGSTFLAGDKITLEKQSKIERDLFTGGNQVFNHATVGGSFFSDANNASISGTIGKNVKVTATDLYVEAGEIKGDLAYNSENEATISKDSKILGKTVWRKPVPQTKPIVSPITILTDMLLGIIGLLIVWFVIKLIRPRFWNTLGGNIKNNLPKSLGFGALALIVTPTAIFFLFITIVGIPLALILACVYGIAFYISKIIVASYIGLLLKEKFKWSDKHKGVWTSLLGLLILSVLGLVPFIGLIVKVFTILAGLGSLVIYANNKEKNKEIPKQIIE